MTKIILVSATAFEIEPTLRFLEPYAITTGSYQFKGHTLDVCITGVGMVNTAFELGRKEAQHYALAINAGIAGGFGNYVPGDVVNVKEDCFCELGAEDDEQFLSIDAMGFGEQKAHIKYPFKNAVSDSLPVACGVTVNKVHGNEKSIGTLLKLHAADIESMEGAAFIHAANAFGWKAVQLRAISNKVEKRNRENWQIPLAIRRLNEVLISLLQEISADK